MKRRRVTSSRNTLTLADAQEREALAQAREIVGRMRKECVTYEDGFRSRPWRLEYEDGLALRRALGMEAEDE